MPDFKSFKEFYSWYLDEHKNPYNRRMHFLGILLAILSLVLILALGRYKLLWLTLVLGYGCAWIGHFFFEKNHPATFRHPLYSLLGDLTLCKDMLLRRKGH